MWIEGNNSGSSPSTHFTLALGQNENGNAPQQDRSLMCGKDCLILVLFQQNNPSECSLLWVPKRRAAPPIWMPLSPAPIPAKAACRWKAYVEFKLLDRDILLMQDLDLVSTVAFFFFNLVTHHSIFAYKKVISFPGEGSLQQHWKLGVAFSQDQLEIFSTAALL